MRRNRMLLALAVAVVAAGSAAPAWAGKKKASVKIVNQSDWAIHHFFLSAIDQDEWGPDQLGKDTIENGDSFTLTDIACDTYDVRLVDEDGDECLIGGVDLCGQKEAWAITSEDLLSCQKASQKAGKKAARGARHATVRIENRSDWAVHHFFLSAVDQDDWGPDQLGDETIEPGEYFTLTDIECYTYDLKVVDEDGEECEVAGVDLCGDASIWKLTNAALLSCEGFER